MIVAPFDDNYIMFKAAGVGGQWYPAYMPKVRREVLSLCEPLVMHKRYLRFQTQELCELFLTHYVAGSVHEVVRHGRLFLLPVAYVKVLRGKPVYSGVNVHSKVLTWDDVHRMRALYAGGGYSHSQLAGIFNCNKATVTFILTGRSWVERQE